MEASGEPIGTLDLTLPDVLELAGDGYAAIEDGEVLSYEKLRGRARGFAGELAQLGVAPTDRVALLVTNCSEFLVAQYGALQAGAVVVPINTRLGTREIEAVLAHSEAVVVVAEERFREVELRRKVLGIRPALPSLRHVVQAEELREVEAGEGTSAAAELRSEDPAVLLYTSGTTGRPKGCLHAHRSFVNSARVTAESKDLHAEDRVLASVPFFNAFGSLNCILESFWAGACIVMQRSFEAADALDRIERDRVTVFLGTPTMWIRLREHPRFSPERIRSLRTGIVAGARAPQALVEEWRRLGCDLRVIYGMSELFSILEDGRPTPNTAVAVEESGELRARGPSRMLEYFRDSIATEERIVDGWVRTGDVASPDACGQLEIVGRTDDMMIVGGFNVQPGEVEDVLRLHPGVADAAVFGVRDREYGERVAAWVVPRASAELDLEALREFCRRRVAGFKVPTYLHRVEELPLTANGKVQRYRMREATEREMLSLEAPAGASD